VPLVPLVAVLLLVLALILAMPLLLVLRYRADTVRRRGRRWVATLNLVMIVLSAGLFLHVSAIVNFWVPGAFRYSLSGLIGGGLLGLVGLALTRWEETPQALHYTPNRWLILIVTFVVTARLLYGVWRIWHGWRASGSDTSWLEEAGVAGSLALGAIILGYYITYSSGVWWRLRRRDKT
jgi:hypothetical protein